MKSRLERTYEYITPIMYKNVNVLWKVFTTVLNSHSVSIRLSKHNTINNQGPVVQSIVSLTSSLWVISLTVLADSINIKIF